MNSNIEISVISPVYKADNLIDVLIERTISSLNKISDSFEIILVDDCSPDNSWARIKDICNKYSQVKGIRLSRNYGQQHAIQAGLDASKGEYIITMDCDLQDRPEEIEKLLAKAKNGYEIVVASRQNRQDDFLKKLFSKIFYSILGYLTETKQDSSIANFVVYHRSVVDAMASLKDYNRYYPMLQQIVGYNYTKVDIEHAQREDGKSSYSLKKRLKLALNTTLTFSDKPLRITVKIGILFTILSLSFGAILIVQYFLGKETVQGWASLAILLSFFSGIIISVLGMIGLYIGRIFESVKNRPSYIIKEQIN